MLIHPPPPPPPPLPAVIIRWCRSMTRDQTMRMLRGQGPLVELEEANYQRRPSQSHSLSLSPSSFSISLYLSPFSLFPSLSLSLSLHFKPKIILVWHTNTSQKYLFYKAVSSISVYLQTYSLSLSLSLSVHFKPNILVMAYKY